MIGSFVRQSWDILDVYNPVMRMPEATTISQEQMHLFERSRVTSKLPTSKSTDGWWMQARSRAHKRTEYRERNDCVSKQGASARASSHLDQRGNSFLEGGSGELVTATREED